MRVQDPLAHYLVFKEAGPKQARLDEDHANAELGHLNAQYLAEPRQCEFAGGIGPSAG